MNRLFVFATVVLAFVWTACTQQPPASRQQTGQATATKEHACCAASEAAGTAISDKSVYQLDASWTDMNGKEIRLADLRGKVRVVAMIFTSCAYVCPRITTDMIAMESGMSEAVRNDVGFVLFSIDPERDTPKALASYAQKLQLDPAHWTLLRSDEDTIRELAAVLGVKYKREPSGDYAHSVLITVLNKEGEIVHRQEGLGQDPRKTLDVVNSLVVAQ